jgi:type I restriction enzyme, S subunit
MTTWNEMALGEFVTLQRGHDLPDTRRHPGTVPVMGSFGLTGFHDEVKMLGPGVTVGRSGASFGVVSYCPVDYWPLNTALYVNDFHGNDPRFAYYLLQSIDFTAFNSGSAQPSLNRNFIHPIRIRVPDLEAQLRIADILGSLDDKIEANRRINQTLESIVQRLFKSWFVNFDPVHAKSAVRRQHTTWTNDRVSREALPNLDSTIAELFPDDLDESTLGPIPTGWRAGTVAGVADNPRRGIKPDQITPDTPYIALEHMPRRSIALAEWTTADGVESSKFEFHRGEILFGKLRPYFHKVGIAPIDGVCSTDVLVIVPNSAHWHAFAVGHIASEAMIAHTNAASTGTKMPRTNWSDIARFEIVIPNDRIAAAYQEIVEPIFERIAANIHESRPLAATRDRLLPSLLSSDLLCADGDFSCQRGP